MLILIKPNVIYKEQAPYSFLNFSHCHLCKYYQMTGRRGGFCHKLGVTVKGNWSTCSLGEFPFSIEIKTK